ncbi:MAG: LysR family transcriptional regulator [Aliishimia sp.]
MINVPLMGDQYTIEKKKVVRVDGSSAHVEAEMRFYPLLFEILRSFTMLAAKLNLSHAVRELGSTRQTVRRHITQLEEMQGGDLFAVNDRQYQLTPLGEKVLPEAQDLLARANCWVNGDFSLINGLQYLRNAVPDGWSLFQQQHPISKVFTSTGDLMKDTMSAWVASGGALEHDAFKAVRPYLMVFRRVNSQWLCVELGEECSYVSWFGWAAARSSIGRDLGQMPGGSDFGRLVDLAYIEVETNQGMRLDHTFTQVPRENGGPAVPICYERLLLASRFPDGSFAMISSVRRTHDVEIHGVSDDMLRKMPEDLVM